MLNNKQIIVILDNIRSVHNVGAIFRTCDGAGVHSIHLCGITPTPEHKKVHKTALNAEEYVKWEYFKSTQEAVNKAKEQGYAVFSVEQNANSSKLNEYDFPEKTALIFGNEITGIGPAIMESSDKVIELPMAGKKNSLNVATCVGIVVYYIKMKL
ncbi:tRNA (guanosine(18)-2'-O)-methyltransferase [Patescibacteria group bacterium]|nr:tRNA (guanosine(18)-2'-O)-methyltransferase [Patescibacteria group bacterium]